MSAKDKPRRRLIGAVAQSERGRGPCAIGVLAAKLARPIASGRDGVLVRLKADWGVIVGQEWAGAVWPTALARDGGLKLRTAAAVALEVQHHAPLLIERINLYLGRRVITRLVLVQSAICPGTPATTSPQRSPAAGEMEACDRQLGGIADPGLRAALARLGHAIRAAGG